MARAINTTGINGLTTSFEKITINMDTPNSTFDEFVSLVFVQGSNWNGSPSTITLKISEDAAGDELLLTSTISTIDAGCTTATAFGCGWKVAGQIHAQTNNLYFWLKTDTGSVDINKLVVTYTTDD